MTQSLPSDETLIERARRDDAEAFRQLVQRHQEQVRATVFGMLGDAMGADDVAQEVFIRLYRSLGKFRGDAKLSTYLSRIAINLSLNELKRRQRKKGRMISLHDDQMNIQPTDPHADPLRQDTRETVQRAISLLDPDFRAVVVLRMIDGYSVQETADILQLPMGTIASRLSRGQQKLKEIFEKWGVL